MKDEDKLSTVALRNYHHETWHTPQGKSIREVVFGMNDGLISMIGFIAGLIGAVNDHQVLLIGGVAEMIAGAISMALGSYLSTKSQIDFFSKEIEREKKEIKNDPERERSELVEIYSDYGFTDEEVEIIVNRITSTEEMWLKFMIKEELGLIEENFESPFKNGLITGVAFLIGSIPPLFPYFLGLDMKLSSTVAITMAVITLVLIGVGKAKITGKSYFKSGFEVFGLGVIASVLGYFIGHLFSYLL